MKPTKAQLVDYLYNNFELNGNKLTKARLNNTPYESLMKIITNNNCEKEFEEWINKPKMEKFMVDGILDGKECSWDTEAENEEECRKAFESEVIVVHRIVSKKTHHRCKYCNGIAKGKQSDLLCDKCREIFGHTMFSEL